MPGVTRNRPLEQMRGEVQRMVRAARTVPDRGRLIEALEALAEICDRLEDWAGARAAAEELVLLVAADVQTWVFLADARGNLGDLAAASQAYAQASALAPDEPMLRRNYADVLIRLGRLGEATFQLDVAERLEPASAFQALRWAELARALGDRAEAQRWAEEALRRQPGWRDAAAILAWARGA